MERAESCVCCQEIEQVKISKLRLSVLVNVKNNPNALHSTQAFTQCVQIDGSCKLLGISTSNSTKTRMMGPKKLFRHIAYRQLARWCWGILGKEIRVVLPSCAVMCIRNFYLTPGPEEEFIFKGFRYADE